MVTTANFKVAVFGATAALVLIFGAFLVTTAMANAQTPPSPTPAPTQQSPAQPGQTTPAQPGQAAPDGQTPRGQKGDCPEGEAGGAAPSGSGTSFRGAARGSQVRY